MKKIKVQVMTGFSTRQCKWQKRLGLHHACQESPKGSNTALLFQLTPLWLIIGQIWPYLSLIMCSQILEKDFPNCLWQQRHFLGSYHLSCVIVKLPATSKMLLRHTETICHHQNWYPRSYCAGSYDTQGSHQRRGQVLQQQSNQTMQCQGFSKS